MDGVRYSIRLKNPNPLFVEWIDKWRDDALRAGCLQKAQSLTKALDSLKKYPLPLETGKDCLILKGFGLKLCRLLDKKLLIYNKNKNLRINDEETISNNKEIIVNKDKTSNDGEIVINYETTKSKSKKQSKKKIKSVKEKQAKKTQQDLLINENLLFDANSFDVILLVDVQETQGKTVNPELDPLLSGLNEYRAIYEVRHLKVGDYLWIARHKETNKELVLPYIVERKRIDDFSASIKDGRFHEQKFRLKQTGIQNLIYLIESYKEPTKGNQKGLLPERTLFQASSNTLVQDKFTLKYTYNLKETIRYLLCMSQTLHKYYKMKILTSCSQKDLNEGKGEENEEIVPLLAFNELQAVSAKTKRWTVQEMFIRQLLQIKSVSFEKALAIAEKYETPLKLKSAFDSLPLSLGEKLLANLEYGQCHKKIGPSVSKIIHNLFTLNEYSG